MTDATTLARARRPHPGRPRGRGAAPRTPDPGPGPRQRRRGRAGRGRRGRGRRSRTAGDAGGPRVRSRDLGGPRPARGRVPAGDRRRRPGQRPRLAGVPGDRPRGLLPRGRSPRLVLPQPLPLLGRAAGDTRHGEPRRRLGDRRSHDRRLGAAGGAQRPAERPRSGLEVPRADHARTDGGAPGHRRPLRRRVAAGRRPRGALVERTPARGQVHAASGDADRVRAADGRLGDQGGLGAGAQLAARCSQRGAHRPCRPCCRRRCCPP